MDSLQIKTATNQGADVSKNLTGRFKHSYRLQFQNVGTEAKYRDARKEHGSATLAFVILGLINLSFAYLESRAFGAETLSPMFGYLVTALIALINVVISRTPKALWWLRTRLLLNGLIGMSCLVAAVFLQSYSSHHVLEFALFAVWLGGLGYIRAIITTLVNLLVALVFVAVIIETNVSDYWISLVTVMLATAISLASYTGYLAERARRQLFLASNRNRNTSDRQELWAFTLTDLELTLNGVKRFDEMLILLKKHLKPVIGFDSSMLTSLRGHAMRPQALKIEGSLFADKDKTIWSEDLLDHLARNRQSMAHVESSNSTEVVESALSGAKTYRLDVPVFGESKLVAVISLRRRKQAFDELDRIASASLAAQAMLIFEKTSLSSETQSKQASAKSAPTLANSKQPPPKKAQPSTRLVAQSRALHESFAMTKPPDTDDRDLEMTDSKFNADGTLIPKLLMNKLKAHQASKKKTITLMSRDNADRIARDLYRNAATTGEPLSVLIVEVDGLSKLREKDGDQVAYKVFAAIVKSIFSRVDKSKDILGRYGQNGLSILMPNVDMNAAERFAETLRYSVSNTRYKTTCGDKTATLSIGITAITDESKDYSLMIKRADMALFVAKKNGRNCVKVRL